MGYGGGGQKHTLGLPFFGTKIQIISGLKWKISNLTQCQNSRVYGTTFIDRLNNHETSKKSLNRQRIVMKSRTPRPK